MLLPWERAGELCPVRTSPCSLSTPPVELAGLLRTVPGWVCCKYSLAVPLPCPRAANKQGVGAGKQKVSVFYFPRLFVSIV